MNNLFSAIAASFFLFGIINPATADIKNLITDCNSLDKNAYLQEANLATLEKTELAVEFMSTEGANVDIYRQNGNLAVVKVSIFGEMGKTKISYYFNPLKNKEYLSEVSDYRYTAPITHKNSRVRSISTERFLVCGDDTLSASQTEGNGRADKAYSLAVETLNDVLEALQQ